MPLTFSLPLMIFQSQSWHGRKLQLDLAGPDILHGVLRQLAGLIGTSAELHRGGTIIYRWFPWLLVMLDPMWPNTPRSGFCIHWVLVTELMYREITLVHHLAFEDCFKLFNVFFNNSHKNSSCLKTMKHTQMGDIGDTQTIINKHPICVQLFPLKSRRCTRHLLEHHRSLRPRADGIQDLFEGLQVGLEIGTIAGKSWVSPCFTTKGWGW